MVKQRCKMCNGSISHAFYPMEYWKVQGPICGNCYSKKIAEHYPGDHVRIDTGSN